MKLMRFLSRMFTCFAIKSTGDEYLNGGPGIRLPYPNGHRPAKYKKTVVNLDSPNLMEQLCKFHNHSNQGSDG